MKPIIHFRIPVQPNNPDNIAIRPQLAGKFIKLVKEQLGDDYIIIATPFDIDIIGAEYQKNCG